MLIKRLELENFKSYPQATIPFQPGTNAITGDNGSGKSSIVEAIGFALFDYQPDGVRLTDLLREGSSSGSVVVRFVSPYDECEYEVERQFSERATTRYSVYSTVLGRQVLAEGAEDVKDWLREHLGLDEDVRLDYTFENTVGVPQGTFTAPFQQPASARKEIFDPLMRVDEYQKASDGLREAERKLEHQERELRQALARLEGELVRLPKARQEREQLESALEELGQEIGALREEQDKVLQHLQQLDQAEERLQEIERRRNEAEDTLAAEERHLDTARQALEEAEKAKQLVQETELGHQEYSQADERLQELDEKRNERDTLLAERGDLANEETRLNTEHENVLTDLEEIATAAERMEELAPLLEKQKKTEAALATVRQDVHTLTNLAEREEQVAQQIEEEEKEVARIRAELTRAEALAEEIEEKREKREELVRRERAVNEEMATKRAERERLAEQSARLEESEEARCPVCEAPLTPEHRQELLARNAQEMEQLKERITKLEIEAQDLGDRASEIDDKLEKVRRELQALASEGELQHAERRLSRQRDKLQELQEQARALRGARGRVETLEEELEALGDPRGEYRILQSKVQERETKEAQRAKVENALRQVREKIEELDQELESFGKLGETIQRVRETRERHSEAHNTYLANLQVAQQYPRRREALQKSEVAVNDLRDRLQELEQELEASRQGYDATEHARIREKEDSFKQELTEKTTRQAERRDRLEALITEIEGLEALAEERDQKRLAMERVEGLKRIVGTVRSLLREAGPHVTRHLVHRISVEASNLYAEIMGSHRGRLHWSVDYELSLEVRGRRRTFRQFSGGEQMGAALALRLALLHEILPIDVAFFDEPTAHLDPARRDGLAEKIMQVKGFSQLFVISHDDTFERAAQNYVRIVKDDNGSHLEEA